MSHDESPTSVEEDRREGEIRGADLEDLARRLRGSLASLRAATETLERYPAMDSDPRRRLHGVVADESTTIEALVGELERLAGGSRPGRRRQVSADELLTAVHGAVTRPGLEVESHSAADLEGTTLDIDGDVLATACFVFAAALRKTFAVLRCRLRASEIDRHWLLDWSWLPEATDAARLQDWQGQALEDEESGPSLRTAARDHGGEAWFDLDRSPGADGRRAHVRVLLPLAVDP